MKSSNFWEMDPWELVDLKSFCRAGARKESKRYAVGTIVPNGDEYGVKIEYLDSTRQKNSDTVIVFDFGDEK